MRFHDSKRRTISTAIPLFVVLLLLVCASSLHAQTYTVIHNFSGAQDGAHPYTGLTMDSTGHLYGTTFAGGTGRYGTVFSLTPSGGSWTLSTLYNFAGGQDGAGPISRLQLAAGGVLYGATSAGGGGPCLTVNNYHGCGTIFKLSPSRGPVGQFSWVNNTMFRFSGTNGSYPQGDLTFDSSGNIFGTAINGGQYGWGLIYELSPSGGSWSQHILYQARNDGDGQYPWGGVVFDRSGNAYGVFTGGGPSGFGAVYKLTRSGGNWTENTLHGFTFHGDDGAFPQSGLIIDSAGNLYGATVHVPNAGGTAYEMATTGGELNYNFVYEFTGGINLGPYDKLVMDSAGNLYGTTFGDGRYGFGSVFKLTRSGGGWSYHSLHDFTGGHDGANPMSALLIDSSGNLYGTASFGGSFNGGVVFKITP